jgi:hypothetical protein
MTALGICGAHRTGKTTLAKALSKVLNMPFVEIGTSNIFRERGLDPAKPMDSRTRLLVQQTILRCACNIWDGMDEAFICDRTPIDMAAYMLTDVGNGELDQHTQDEIMSYIGRCFQVTKKYFGKIVLVPPAIPFIPAQYKAANNEPLIFKLHYEISGMLLALGVDYRKLPNDCIELSDRVEFVEEFWREN